MSRFNIELREQTLVVNLPDAFQVLSWAPFNPGQVQTQCIFNHQLSGNTKNNFSEIFQDLRENLGLPENAVGMLTAADVEQYSTHYFQSGSLWVQAVCTVGLDNTRTAGDEADVENSCELEQHGTINIVLATNALPDLSGQLEAIQVVTMAKTRALMEMGVKSSKSGTPATGTGTDCIVLASSGEVKQNYCGMHTRIGQLIGQTVYDSVKEGTEKIL
ncbi:MAG: adenosylcobinamide amidohydrolase [Nitrospinae bacterium]|nr:adenosylcobinamide amidohydrolase [Nitrospinota bacterium]